MILCIVIFMARFRKSRYDQNEFSFGRVLLIIVECFFDGAPETGFEFFSQLPAHTQPPVSERPQ